MRMFTDRAHTGFTRPAVVLPEESRGERRLKVGMCVALLVATTVAIICVSFIPEVAPENVRTWRLVLGVPAIALALAAVVIELTVRGKNFQRLIELGMFSIIVVNAILLQITPATTAVLYNMVATLIFAGYFARTPALVITLVSACGVAISTAFTEPAMNTPHLTSFLIVYVPTLVTVTLLLHLQNAETLSALRAARMRSLTDPLTGLANLRALEKYADRRFGSDAVRAGSTGLLLIDLDNFKSANSRFGHVGGDYALRTIARQMMRVAPRDALVARVGGDEFAVLLPADSHASMEETGEMFRAAVRAGASLLDMPGVEIDATVGVATWPDDGRDLGELLDVADRSVYRTKGKKRHVVAKVEAPLDNGTVHPDWLDGAGSSGVELTARMVSLDSVVGGSNPALARRTLYARTSAFAWAFGAVLLGVSMAIPDAPADMKIPWWFVLFGGLAIAAAIFWFNAEPQTPVHRLFDTIALAGIAALIWATGGYASAVPPLLILLIASQAWFWKTRNLPMRVVGPALVVLSPLLYEPFALSGPLVLNLVAMYALLVIVTALVLAMYANRVLLTKLSRRAEELAGVDPLTGIANRRTFDAYVKDLLARPDKGGKFAIVMIDLDNFKQVNSSRGHRGGDTVLRAIAAELHQVSRAGDCIARVGGDEFAAVLPGVGVDGARSLAERFVAAVAGAPAAAEAGVGASAGFALHPLHGETLDELVFTADNALMNVKATGKGTARVARLVSVA